MGIEVIMVNESFSISLTFLWKIKIVFLISNQFSESRRVYFDDHLDETISAGVYVLSIRALLPRNH